MLADSKVENMFFFKENVGVKRIREYLSARFKVVGTFLKLILESMLVHVKGLKLTNYTK